GDGLAADLAGDVLAVQPDVTVVDDNVERRQMPHERSRVLERESGAQHAQRERAVHGAGRNQLVAEPLGEPPCHRRLARAGGAVDRHHEATRPHQRSTVIASPPASALSVSTNVGNDVCTHAVSSITVSPSATRPATASAIAIRWSPAEATRAPRKRCPPGIAIPSARPSTPPPLSP